MKLRTDQLFDMSLVHLQEEIVRALALHFPDVNDVPRSDFRKEMRNQVNRAMGYGLATQRECAMYVLVAWVLGTEFDTDFPAAQEILRSSDIDSTTKADWLLTWTIALFETLEGRSRQ